MRTMGVVKTIKKKEKKKKKKKQIRENEIWSPQNAPNHIYTA